MKQEENSDRPFKDEFSQWLDKGIEAYQFNAEQSSGVEQEHHKSIVYTLKMVKAAYKELCVTVPSIKPERDKEMENIIINPRTHLQSLLDDWWGKRLGAESLSEFKEMDIAFYKVKSFLTTDVGTQSILDMWMQQSHLRQAEGREKVLVEAWQTFYDTFVSALVKSKQYELASQFRDAARPMRTLVEGKDPAVLVGTIAHIDNKKSDFVEALTVAISSPAPSNEPVKEVVVTEAAKEWLRGKGYTVKYANGGRAGWESWFLYHNGETLCVDGVSGQATEPLAWLSILRNFLALNPRPEWGLLEALGFFVEEGKPYEFSKSYNERYIPFYNNIALSSDDAMQEDYAVDTCYSHLNALIGEGK